MSWWEVIVTEMTMGNFSFLILIVGVLSLLVGITQTIIMLITLFKRGK